MKEKYVQIAERQVGKGDTWKLLSDGKIYSSLTITLDMYFNIIQKHFKNCHESRRCRAQLV
jgi:hypothetical protein